MEGAAVALADACSGCPERAIAIYTAQVRLKYPV
jgi:hypothetical protein